MSLRPCRPQGRHDAHFHRRWRSIPVTVLDVSNNRVTQIKTPETDGYAAVQVTFGKRRASRVNKAAAGHLAKAGVEAGHVLKEFRVAAEAARRASRSATRSASTCSRSARRSMSPAPPWARALPAPSSATTSRRTAPRHGNSRVAQLPGSIGMAQDPGRVFPGKRMAGHLGDVTAHRCRTSKIVRIDAERQLLLVKGAVPGAKGGDVIVRARAVQGQARRREASDGTQADQ